MVKSKTYFSDRIIKALQDAFPNIDFKISEREVFLVIDDVVNALAKENYFENWKLYGAGLDEGFITEWSGDNAIAVVDPDGGEDPSYIVMPATPAALPRHGGVVEVWPSNWEYGSVKIMDHSDIRRTRKLMSGNLQGELGGYRSGNRFVFNQTEVRKNYAETCGVRLAVKDSSEMTLTEVYPIPSNLQEIVIQRVVDHFKNRRMEPTDTVRDKNDALNRN